MYFIGGVSFLVLFMLNNNSWKVNNVILKVLQKRIPRLLPLLTSKLLREQILCPLKFNLSQLARFLRRLMEGVKAKPFLVLAALSIAFCLLVTLREDPKASADVCTTTLDIIEPSVGGAPVDAAPSPKVDTKCCDIPCRLRDPETTRQYVNRLLAQRDRDAKQRAAFQAWYAETQWRPHGMEVRRQVNCYMYPILPEEWPDYANVLARYYSHRRAWLFRAAYDNGHTPSDIFPPYS